MALSDERLKEILHSIGECSYACAECPDSGLCTKALRSIATAAAEDMRERAAKACEERAVEWRQDDYLQAAGEADDCAEAAKRGDKTLEKIINRSYSTVSPDTPACDLISLLAETHFPLAVVNDQH